MKWRCVLHVDMDSFFATAEQQANPVLRGKPIVVSGKEGTRSVVVASSKEAKKFGVKTGLLHHEAKRLCPQIIFIEPDGLKYDFLHHQLIDVLRQITDKIEVFSIDEAFLDLSECTSSFEDVKVITQKIKALIKDRLGDWVTCSIGVAQNKLLAKLASDKNKPNGFLFVDSHNQEEVLLSSKLKDFCGLGPRTVEALNNLGIDSVLKLREVSLNKLISLFGDVRGHFLFDLCRGIDDRSVIDAEVEAKSVSRSYTLQADTYNKEQILSVAMHLCESIGHELRHKKLSTKKILFYLRYSDFTHSGFRLTLPNTVSDNYHLFMIIYNKFNKFILPKSVRLIGVCVTNLISFSNQQSLFSVENKLVRLSPYLDKINETYGELTIKPAFLLNLKRLRNKVGGFKPQE